MGVTPSHSIRYRLATALLLGHRALRKISRQQASKSFRILMFHHVPRAHRKSFENLLRYVIRTHGVITPKEAEAFLEGGNLTVKEGRVPFLLTFDDGFKSQAIVAQEILNQYGVKAIFFVCPKLIEIPAGKQLVAVAEYILDGKESADGLPREMELMTWQDLKTLIDDGHSVGSHTGYHRRLSDLSPDELSNEIIGSAMLLRDRLSVSIDWFAYPFGNLESVDRVSFEMIGKCHRFSCSGIRGMNSEKTHPFALLRDQIDPSSPFQYQRLILEGGLDLYYWKRARHLRAIVGEMAGGLTSQ